MIRTAIWAMAFAVVTSPALAQTDPPKRPAAFEQLLGCRALTDPAARLACYDTQVERFDTAEKNSEVVVLDKAEVKKARRGLFGFSIPDLGIFGGRKSDPEVSEEITEIESILKSADLGRDGKWRFVIEDGARWLQTEAATIRTPKAGMKIRIRRAALGSYFANIEGRPAVRVRREN